MFVISWKYKETTNKIGAEDADTATQIVAMLETTPGVTDIQCKEAV